MCCRLAAADHGAWAQPPALRGPLRGARAGVLGSVAAAGVGALDEMDRAEQRTALYDGLDKLKPVDRATLVAFYLRGRSLQQMSSEFETPVGTIKRRLHVARKRLKREMEKTNPDVSPEGVGREEVYEDDRELACV